MGADQLSLPCKAKCGSNKNSQVHERPKCDTHEHFCLIFGNIVILTNLSTLISKIIVAKLNSCVKVVFWGI